ncbi:hypothetical protein [Baekduia alba]|nr:hypothetical protein [Baekduia alba]
MAVDVATPARDGAPMPHPLLVVLLAVLVLGLVVVQTALAGVL